MGCQTVSLPPCASNDLQNCNKGLQPLCKPLNAFQPPTIQCKATSSEFVTTPLCDLLPPYVYDSLPDFLINFPIVLLYAVSTPARFLYCLAYQLLFNGDSIIDSILNYFIYPLIDLLTSPFLYFTVGFSYGEQNELPPAPGLWGYITDACISGLFESIYIGFNSIFYYLGYAIGFLSGALIDLIDLLIYFLCYITFLTFDVGFCVAVGVANLFNYSGGFNITIQPFALFKDILCGIINCGCSLGSPPRFEAGLCLQLGASCPSDCACSFGYQAPKCPVVPLGEPPQSITLSDIIVSESEYVYPPPSESSSESTSETNTGKYSEMPSEPPGNSNQNSEEPPTTSESEGSSEPSMVSSSLSESESG